MEIKKPQIIGMIAGAVLLIADFIFLRDLKIFYFLIGISLIVTIIPFIVSLVIESSREKENNAMFLEFSRNLVESVKAGTPISKAIINLRYKNYGSLTPHIKKLVNQISIGIPVKESLEIFARDVKSKVITRAVTLISQAEKAGGEIGNILESVAKSVSEVEKLKKERQAAVYNMVMQGYIIFIVFIVIMLIMQFKILPMSSEISMAGGGFGNIGGIGGGNSLDVSAISRPILYLLIVQGFFTGLIVGKLANGSFKFGLKHSFAMIALALLIYTGAGAFF